MTVMAAMPKNQKSQWLNLVLSAAIADFSSCARVPLPPLLPEGAAEETEAVMDASCCRRVDVALPVPSEDGAVIRLLEAGAFPAATVPETWTDILKFRYAIQV